MSEVEETMSSVHEEIQEIATSLDLMMAQEPCLEEPTVQLFQRRLAVPLKMKLLNLFPALIRNLARNGLQASWTIAPVSV